MPDLVAELRASAVTGTHVGDCLMRAADEIDRLRAVQATLEAAAEAAAQKYEDYVYMKEGD